eukprot:5489584-Amphidinium_carterae.1
MCARTLPSFVEAHEAHGPHQMHVASPLRTTPWSGEHKGYKGFGLRSTMLLAKQTDICRCMSGRNGAPAESA